MEEDGIGLQVLDGRKNRENKNDNFLSTKFIMVRKVELFTSNEKDPLGRITRVEKLYRIQQSSPVRKCSLCSSVWKGQ